jgi:hypothetical protein
MTATDFDRSVAALDVSIFRIDSQTSIEDRRSFLAIQNAVRDWKSAYVYLECGSHLGGSLLPHILDSRCRLAYSVDKRPPIQPDERGINYEYPQNSSQRMIATLGRHVTAGYLAKLRTFDKDAGALAVRDIEQRPDLVLIDAEHTNAAVFSDFLHIYRLCHPSTIYIFHDANLILSGLDNIEMFLRYSGVAFDSYVLPGVVYLVALNEAREIVRPVGAKFGMDKDRFAIWSRQELMKSHYEVVRQILARGQRPGI